MRRTIQKLALSGACLFAGITALQAQGEPVERKSRVPYAASARYTVSVEPLNFLLSGGAPRVNIEKRIGRKEWVGVSATGYWMPANHDYGWETMDSGFESFSHLKGFGLGGTCKYYFLPVLFAGAGASYSHFNVQYPGFGFYEYVEDGLTYYEFRQQEQHQYFNRYAGNACVGVHTFRHAFFVEVTLGIGYSHSFYDASRARYDGFYGFGYRGFYPTFGFKMGLNLK